MGSPLSAVTAFFAWWTRYEETLDYDPVSVLELWVRRLEEALAESRSTAEPTKTQ